MKALDVISEFDNLRPNSFDFAMKKSWLDTIESDIKYYISLHKNSVETFDAHEDNPTLSLAENYKDIYVYYLISKGDMANGEFRLYNISSAYFNALFDKWKREYRDKNPPLKNTAIKC